MWTVRISFLAPSCYKHNVPNEVKKPTHFILVLQKSCQTSACKISAIVPSRFAARPIMLLSVPGLRLRWMASWSPALMWCRQHRTVDPLSSVPTDMHQFEMLLCRVNNHFRLDLAVRRLMGILPEQIGKDVLIMRYGIHNLINAAVSWRSPHANEC